MMMGFGFIGMLAMLIFWILIIVGAVWLLKSIFPGVIVSDSRDDKRSMNAREILDHRYARGEITREQFIGMIEDLESTGK